MVARGVQAGSSLGSGTSLLENNWYETDDPYANRTDFPPVAEYWTSPREQLERQAPLTEDEPGHWEWTLDPRIEENEKLHHDHHLFVHPPGG